MAQLDAPFLYELEKRPTYFRMILSSVLGGSSYAVQRSLTSDFASYTTIYTGPADTPFNDTTIADGNTYYYRAYALAFGGNTDSDFSPTVIANYSNVTQLNPPVFTLGEVDRFYCRLLIYSVINAAGYLIERDVVDTFDVDPVVIPYSPGEIYDNTLQPGGTYYYRAKSLSGSGDFSDSNWSNVVEVTTLSYPALPQPSLSVSNVTDNSVDISISGVTGAVNYNIFRSTRPDFADSTSVYFGASLTYVDTPLVDDTNYYYRVQAASTANNAASPFSDIVNITTLESDIPDPSDEPIPGLKYFMSFKDVNGVGFIVTIYFNGWTGAVTQLTGDAEPVRISYTGFDNDIYEKAIIDSTHTINIKNENFSDGFYEDITGVGEKEAWVRIERSSDNYVFSGWLVGDESNRSFSKHIYKISLSVVSPFSIMKTTDLLEADLKMMYGSKLFSEIVTRCIASSIHPSLAPKYTIQSDLREKDYIGSQDLFNQIREIIESFNDDNGKPPKCYDMIDKISSALGFQCLWVNDSLLFRDPYNFDQEIPLDIKIKQPEGDSEILLGNTEVINKVRSSREVSNKFAFSKAVGLLMDGRFLQSTDNVLNYWYYFNLRRDGNVVTDYITPRWSGNPTGTVERRGNGRPVNPYRVRFWGEISKDGRQVNVRYEVPEQGLLTTTGRLRLNDMLTISLRYRYFDWRRKYSREDPNHIDNRVPYLFVSVLAIPPNYSWQEINFLADVKNIEGTDIDIFESNTPFPFWFYDPFNGAMSPVVIAVESTTDIQKYETSLRWKFPSDWTLQVSILGMRWEYGKPVSIDVSDLWVDILDVIVSRQTDAEGYNSTGEITYLTQDINSAKVDETKDVHIGNFTNADISGAILKADNTPSLGLSRDGQDDRVQYWLLRAMMAQKRSPKYKIDCDFKSSVITPTRLLRFVDGTTELLPNRYAIGSLEYNLKSAKSHVTAIEVNKEDREYFIGGEDQDEPNPDYDMLENYKTYS